MILTPDDQQARVIREARTWLGSPGGDQVKYLAGYAGTGKTFLARYLVEGMRVAFCAYTAKAALVLREKGCDGATTIHQLIYAPNEVRRDGKRSVEFVRKDREELRDLDVIVVDECSMCDAQTVADLVSFGIRILYIGDPAQLPPVSGASPFAELEPDWMLTEIHRQARESGVLRLATDIRQGRAINWEPGAYGPDVALVTDKSGVDMSLLLAEDFQILCGRNATRHHVNEWARVGFGFAQGGQFPVADDRLVCLRNAHNLGLANGSMWTAATDTRRVVDGLQLEVLYGVPAAPDALRLDLPIHGHHFTGHEDALKEMGWRDRRDRQEFDFAYGMTVHKAQGSAFDNVCVLDESWCFREDARRWAYTAATRAARQLAWIRMAS